MLKALIVALLITYCLAGQLNQTISLTGPGCTVCGNTPGNYACSSWGSYWQNGLFSFTDLVPSGNIVTDITFRLHGVWGCNTNQANIELSLQGTNVGTKTFFGQCGCGTCDAEEVYTWTNGGDGTCFPGYNYGGINQVFVDVLTGLICLHNIEMTITYQPGNQQTCQTFLLECETLGGCGNGTCLIDTQTQQVGCNCTENFYGPNCQCYVPSFFLITDHPPVLDLANSGFKTKNTLYLSVIDSVKYYNTKITFKNQLDNTCDYPSASQAVTWDVNFNPNDCTNVYNVVIPWNIAWPTCVFDRQEDNQYLIFTGDMIIEHDENLGQLSPSRPGELIRNITNNLLFQVKFPKSVSFSTDIQVFAPVNVLAAIVGQQFDSGYPLNTGIAHITLLTTVQYPFKLTLPVSISSNLPGVTLTINLAVDCSGTGSVCEQYWVYTITPNDEMCNFNGIYTFEFYLTCTSSDCPLDPNTNTGSIVMDLTSENFCPQIVETIDLTGTLQTFQDSLHSIPKDDFLIDQVVYFKSLVSSTEANIVSSVVNQFSVTLWNNINILLYDINSGNTPQGNAGNLQIINNLLGGVECDLQLLLTPSVFPIGVDLSGVVTFHVTIGVTFENTQPARTLSEQTHTIEHQVSLDNGQVSGANKLVSLINHIF
jgi:hypothetical protein